MQTDPTRADRLELVALNDAFGCAGMTIYFSDGRAFSQQMNTIVPGQTSSVCREPSVIQSVELDYGRQIVDRTPALIIPHEDRYVAPVRP